MPGRNRLALCLLGLAALAGQAIAQEPASKPICDLPEYKGTADFAHYCGDGGDTPDFYVDPEMEARAHIASLIRIFPDVINQNAWSAADFQGDNLGPALANLRHQVWAVSAKAAAGAEDQRWLSQQARESLRSVSERLLAVNSRLAEITVSLDEARKQRAALENEVQKAEDGLKKEAELYQIADKIWLDKRNQAVRALRAAFPQAKTLPPDLPGIYYRDLAPPPFKIALRVEPKPDPPSQVYPTPISDLPDPTGHFMPAAETPLPADLTARVAELEQLAQEAHANVRDLQAAKGEADILRQNYDSTSRQVESGEAAVKSGTRELDYLTKYNSGYLSSALASAQESQRFNGWIKVGSAIRAVVWDVASEKIIMPAIQQLPHYSAIDRANKAASLTRQVLSLEQNFELLSASAADVLALGSASDTENVMEQVFGSSREQMHDTVDKALDLIEAPPAAYKGWKAFFNASKDY